MNFQKVCEDGDLQRVQMTNKQHPMSNWNDGLRGACKGGHLQIALLMIKKGATDYSYPLACACESGHLQLAQLMIDCGVKCWNVGLYSACRGGRLQLVQLMIDRGANYWDGGLSTAHENGHWHLVQLMINHGATNLNELSLGCVYWLLEHGISIERFQTHENFNNPKHYDEFYDIKELLLEIKAFRWNICGLNSNLILLPELLTLVSEYSLK